MGQRASELTAKRIARSGLSSPHRSISEAVHHIGAVQAQLLFGAQMAVLNRSSQGISELEGRLDEGQLVISWLNRGTLHMVAREDFWSFQELTAPARIKTLASRFKGFGVDHTHQTRVLERLSQSLSASPKAKTELVPLMDLEAVTVAANMAGIVAASFLELASAHGLLVRGPRSDSEPTYVSTTEWVGARPTAAGDLAAMANRYASAHFASTAEDFAAWLGIGIREARAVWNEPSRDVEPATWTGLLGPFDPLLHGWKDRSWLLGDYVSKVISTNGVFRPSIIVENSCVGVWKFVAGRIDLEFLAGVSPQNERRVRDMAEELSARLGASLEQQASESPA